MIMGARALLVLCVAMGVSAQLPPKFQSAFNITVSNSRWIKVNRTVELDISTPIIDPYAINGPGHRLRITFPPVYFTGPNTRRYPALYLLHGGAGGSSAQWTTEGGVADQELTRNLPLIIVMPDGGKVGWYTDWVNPGKWPQAWNTFILNQVIPFVDLNVRTVALKQGRAVAGLSMGGYGAMRFTMDRPDLFTFVGTFSGAVDLTKAATRTVVVEQAIQNLLPGDGPFGNPFWPFDAVWNQFDPLRRVDTLKDQNITIAMFAGGGSNPADIIENTMRDSAERLKGNLDRAGIPAYFHMYGQPRSPPFNCDGGHNFGCWNFALAEALPRMMAVLQVQ